MKKKYESAELELIVFSNEDVVRTSGEPGENETPIDMIEGIWLQD